MNEIENINCDKTFSKEAISEYDWLNKTNNLTLKSSFQWGSNTSYLIEVYDENYKSWSPIIITLSCQQLCISLEFQQQNATGIHDILWQLLFLDEATFEPVSKNISKTGYYSINLLSKNSGVKLFVRFTNTNYSPNHLNKIIDKQTICLSSKQCDDGLINSELTSFFGFKFEEMMYSFTHQNARKELEYTGSIDANQLKEAFSASKNCEYIASIFFGKTENVFMQCETPNRGTNIFTYPIIKGSFNFMDMPYELQIFMFTKSAAKMLLSLKNGKHLRTNFESDNLHTSKTFGELDFLY